MGPSAAGDRLLRGGVSVNKVSPLLQPPTARHYTCLIVPHRPCGRRESMASSNRLSLPAFNGLASLSTITHSPMATSSTMTTATQPIGSMTNHVTQPSMSSSLPSTGLAAGFGCFFGSSGLHLGKQFQRRDEERSWGLLRAAASGDGGRGAGQAVLSATARRFWRRPRR